MAQEPVHMDDLPPVPGLPPADQNPPGPSEYGSLVDAVRTYCGHMDNFGPGKPISKKVQESNDPSLYQNDVINPRIEADATNEEELWSRRAEQNLATPMTIDDERPVQDQPLTPVNEAIAGLESSVCTIKDEATPLPFGDARTLLPTINELLDALRELNPDTPWPDAYGTASDFVTAVMHGEVLGGLNGYFQAKGEHAVVTTSREQERAAEVQKLRPGEELQATLSELIDLGLNDKRGRDSETAQKVADLKARITHLGETIKLEPKIIIDGDIPMENAEAAMRELQRVDQWVNEQRKVVRDKSAAVREAVHDACNGESSVEAQRHRLEEKQLRAQHLTRQQKEIYEKKLQQVGQSRQELRKERREQEEHRRAEHAKATTRRQDFEAYMNVMDVAFAETDRAILELLRKRISDLNAVRKREHENRVAEAEYQVRLGVVDRNLEAIGRCDDVLAKHEPVLVKSLEVVQKVGKAAGHAMNGFIAHVRVGVMQMEQNEDDIAVDEFEHYCQTKIDLMERFLEAGRNRVLCEQRLDVLDQERETAVKLKQTQVSLKLAAEARGKEEEMDAHRATQEELGDAMRRIDRNVQGPVDRLAARVYADETLTNDHTRRLRKRVQQWVRVPPPVHPKGELEQKAKRDDYQKFKELVDKQERDAASTRRQQGNYVEQLRAEAMLEDRPAACAAGPEEVGFTVEEGVPPGAARGRDTAQRTPRRGFFRG